MTDQYIQMVLALPESFFDGWKWQAGDRAILMDDRYKREVIVISSRNQIVSRKMVNLLFPDAFDESKTEEYVSRLRPVPSQKQLQDILLTYDHDDCGFMSELQALFYWFNYWVKGENQMNGFRNEFSDFDQLWLAFAMHTLHGETWDGENWI